MKRITDPSFRYVPSSQTDLRKTFARIRKQLAEQKSSPVVPIRKVERSL
jgi:hypothetical protein